MTDPGRPFGVPFAELIRSLEESLALGVEQDGVHELVFVPGVLVYPLPPQTSSVVAVSGLSGRAVVTFARGRDYTVGASRLTWLPRTGGGEEGEPRHPDGGSRVQVAYRYRDQPAGLTDLNPGSVVGTLARAVARELAVLYGQLDEAYRRAFLDTATGVALDNVVALLGVARNPAQRATGTVAFTRRSATGDRVVVPVGTVLEDASGRRFSTTSQAVIDAGATDGTATVAAAEPGPRGNVNAGAVTVMPSPPPGVHAVENREAITGGEDPEADGALRERARHALERAGNATVTAMEFAVRDVDGVQDAGVIDRTVDPDVPPGEVRIRYSAAGSPQRMAEIDDEVAQVVDRTRAAGVLVVPERVRAVTISGRLVVLPSGPAARAEAYTGTVTAALQALGIGAPLSLRRLGALAYQVPGLAELAEAQLVFTRAEPVPPSVPATGPVGELLPVTRSEKVQPGELSTVLVTAVEAEAAGAGQPPRTLVVRLVSGGTGIVFSALTVHARVVVRAARQSAPTQAPVIVADLTRTLTFADTAEVPLTLTDEDLDRYRPDEHEPVARLTVSLAAFEAVPAATVELVLVP